jgi:hypothetical protein
MRYAACAGLTAALLADAITARLGVPLWTQWVPGDCVDFMVLSGLLTFYALRALANPLNNQGD